MRIAPLLLVAAASLVALGCARQGPVAQRPPTDTGAPVAVGEGRIEWMDDYEQAAARAQQEGKPLMVDVGATWCTFCKQLDEEVLSRAEVAEAARDFVAVRVDGDKRPDLVKRLEVSGYPTVLLLDANEKIIGRLRGVVRPQAMLDEMARAAGKGGAAEAK